MFVKKHPSQSGNAAFHCVKFGKWRRLLLFRVQYNLTAYLKNFLCRRPRWRDG